MDSGRNVLDQTGAIHHNTPSSTHQHHPSSRRSGTTTVLLPSYTFPVSHSFSPSFPSLLSHSPSRGNKRSCELAAKIFYEVLPVLRSRTALVQPFHCHAVAGEPVEVGSGLCVCVRERRMSASPVQLAVPPSARSTRNGQG